MNPATDIPVDLALAGRLEGRCFEASSGVDLSQSKLEMEQSVLQLSR